MNAWVGVILTLLLGTHLTGSFAQTQAGSAADPVLEARARRIEGELRCVVCQNQTLADSSAPLAIDLRNEIREQLSRGASDDDVQRFLVSRYGEFVLYRPAFHPTTAVLWIGPFLLLALGAMTLARALRRQASLPERDASYETDGV